jgi:large subunit ribosomal protein L31
MKISQHPASIETDITCTCGATVHTRSTVPNVRVAVCSNCHPFFTGRQKMVDTTGRVEAFRKKIPSCKFSRDKRAHAAFLSGNQICSHWLLSSTTFKMAKALLPF